MADLAEQVARAPDRLGQRLGLHVRERDGEAVPRAPGRDVAAHGSRADDVDALAGEAAVGEPLELLAQEEHPHQIARGVGDQEARERRDLGLLHLARVAAVILPQIDQGVRRRIVLDRRPFAGLGTQALGRELASGRAVDDRDEPAAATDLQLAGDCGGGGGFDMALGHHRVDEAERLGTSGAQIAPGQHGAHRLDRIDQPRQAHGAAETGMQPEQHLRQAEECILDCDPVIAGERDFETAAKTVAVNDGDRGHLQLIEPVDQRMRLREARLGGAGVGHGAQLADIGAGDEARGLGRAQHQPFRRIASSFASTSLSSVSTSSVRVLALAPALSRASQAMPL